MGSNIYNNVFDTFSKPVPVPKMLVQYDIPLTKTIAFKFKIIPTEKKIIQKQNYIVYQLNEKHCIQTKNYTN